MKILIVNGYPNNTSGKKKFNDFVNIIKEVSLGIFICFQIFNKLK